MYRYWILRAHASADDGCDCPKRRWAKSPVHHAIVGALCRFFGGLWIRTKMRNEKTASCKPVTVAGCG